MSTNRSTPTPDRTSVAEFDIAEWCDEQRRHAPRVSEMWDDELPTKPA